MKKVLVIGAAGTIGMPLLKYLLSEGKYELTALDLKNKKSYHNLKKYRKRINVIYGDALDRSVIEPLIKESDYVINLATCLPPLAEYKKGLADIIEYNVTDNIVRATNYYNPNCHLIYISTTSLYGMQDGNIKNKITIDELDYYNSAKLKSEKLIIKKCKKYTILRMPLILSDLRKDPFMYNIKSNLMVECISKEDAAYSICKCINNDNVNKKILDIGGGNLLRCKYNDILNNILKYHGLSIKYILARVFMDKNYYSPILSDSDESNKLLNYRNDSLDSYFMRQKRRSNKRKINLLLGKIVLLFKRGDK